MCFHIGSVGIAAPLEPMQPPMMPGKPINRSIQPIRSTRINAFSNPTGNIIPPTNVCAEALTARQTHGIAEFVEELVRPPLVRLVVRRRAPASAHMARQVANAQRWPHQRLRLRLNHAATTSSQRPGSSMPAAVPGAVPTGTFCVPFSRSTSGNSPLERARTTERRRLFGQHAAHHRPHIPRHEHSPAKVERVRRQLGAIVIAARRPVVLRQVARHRPAFVLMPRGQRRSTTWSSMTTCTPAAPLAQHHRQRCNTSSSTPSASAWAHKRAKLRNHHDDALRRRRQPG